MSFGSQKINERLTMKRERRDDRSNGECRLVWTINMEEMLIYYIRGNRILWDPAHPSFTKLSVKKRRVEDIAALLRREVGPEEAYAVTPENTWKKFRAMRMFFLREVKKVHDTRSSIGDDGYTSSWVHYNRMRFLLQALRPKLNQDVNNPQQMSVIGNHTGVPETNREEVSANVNGYHSPVPETSREVSANVNGYHSAVPETSGEVSANVNGYHSAVPETSREVSANVNGYHSAVPETNREELQVSVNQIQEALHSNNDASVTSTPKRQTSTKRPTPVQSSSKTNHRSEGQSHGPPKKHQKTSNPTEALQKIVDTLQELKRDSSDVAATFGNFVSASIRELPLDKQHVVMSKITSVLCEHHQ